MSENTVISKDQNCYHHYSYLYCHHHHHHNSSCLLPVSTGDHFHYDDFLIFIAVRTFITVFGWVINASTAYSPFTCLRDCLQAVVPWHHTIFMKHSNRGLDFLYLHEQEGMQIMHSDTADLVEAIAWQVGWFQLGHPVFALSISVCDDVYDSCVCDIPRLVCNIWRRYEVLVQITVVPTSWVHQIESLF